VSAAATVSAQAAILHRTEHHARAFAISDGQVSLAAGNFTLMMIALLSEACSCDDDCLTFPFLQDRRVQPRIALLTCWAPAAVAVLTDYLTSPR
jgi:hypothetical protein